VAAAVFGTGTTRRGEMIAIRVKEMRSRLN